MAEFKLNKGDKNLVLSYTIPENATDIQKVFYTYVARQVAHLLAVDAVSDLKEVIDVDQFTEFIAGIKVTREDAEAKAEESEKSDEKEPADEDKGDKE